MKQDKLKQVLEMLKSKQELVVEVENNGQKGFFTFNNNFSQAEVIKISFSISRFLKSYQFEEDKNKDFTLEEEQKFIKDYTDTIQIAKDNLLSFKCSPAFIGLNDDEEQIDFDKKTEEREIAFNIVLNELFDKNINLASTIFSNFIIEMNKAKEIKEEVKKK